MSASDARPLAAGRWLVSLARRVILDVRGASTAELGQDRAVLDELGAHAPEVVTDLLVCVARYVPDEVVASIVAAREDLAPVAELIFREAHARYAGDERDEWVRWGESGYHRLAYLRRRDGRGA